MCKYCRFNIPQALPGSVVVLLGVVGRLVEAVLGGARVSMGLNTSSKGSEVDQGFLATVNALQQPQPHVPYLK
jgi:hypothetical protein